ncbi:hypothetical protein [Endozoicomonas sp. 2B-B]
MNFHYKTDSNPTPVQHQLEEAPTGVFPSPHLYQLKAAIKTKDEQQLRDWLQTFANSETIESLIKQRKSSYFPVQLLFSNSKLMSECKKFKLAEKAKITHSFNLSTATFSVDGLGVLTANELKRSVLHTNTPCVHFSEIFC